MRYVFAVPFFTFAVLNAMENKPSVGKPTVDNPTVEKSVAIKPIVTLWAIHNTLMQPHSPTDALPAWVVPSSLDPKKLESELIDAVAAHKSYSNPSAAQHPGKIHPAMKAWLLDLENGDSMKKLARQNISTWTQPILYQVAGAAFSPKDAAAHLAPIAKTVALAKSCKENGHTIALASNWNTESFAEVERQHQEVVSLFHQRFLSGQRKKLTMDPVFFREIQKDLGIDRTYYYIDVAEGTGTESLEAARSGGVTPITFTTPEKLETDLKTLNILPK